MPDSRFTDVFVAVFHLMQSYNNFSTVTVESDYIAAIYYVSCCQRRIIDTEKNAEVP